jgi:hypothetical protein
MPETQHPEPTPSIADKLREACAPDFIVIGAMRSGTTSLYSYITEHPKVMPASKKEIRYFDRNYEQGRQWYRAFFPPAKAFPGVITGEASPSYLLHPLAPRRIRAEYPGVKLIVALRDPVDRAYSHYQLSKRMGKEDLPFEQALDREAERLDGTLERFTSDEHHKSAAYWNQSYVTRGMYADQLRRWLDVFPREQFLVIGSEGLFADPPGVMREVYAWLGVEAHILAEYKKVNMAPHASYAPMATETRQRLADLFRPHNQALYALLGIDFGWDAAGPSIPPHIVRQLG